MAKRKIVLLVVEGASDASLLVPAFSSLIENRLFQGQEFHCDVLAAPNHTILIADRTTKRNGVDALLKLDGFRKKNGRTTLMVPYRLFYVSRNLEHAFRGRIDNLDAQHKQSSAIKLADRFTRNPNLFSTTLQSLRRIHGNPTTWEESWQYAMQDLHSLERGSNLAFVEPYLAGELR